MPPARLVPPLLLALLVSCAVPGCGGKGQTRVLYRDDAGLASDEEGGCGSCDSGEVVWPEDPGGDWYDDPGDDGGWAGDDGWDDPWSDDDWAGDDGGEYEDDYDDYADDEF